jgi:hypothetical protein
MDDKITINGVTYVREDSIEKEFSSDDVIKYLRELPSWEYINIVEDSIAQIVKKGWYDNSDIANGDIDLHERQILAIYLAVN